MPAPVQGLLTQIASLVALLAFREQMNSSAPAVPFTARNSTSRPAAKEPHTCLLHSTVLLAALTQISKLDRQARFDRYCVPQHAPLLPQK